MKTLTFIALTAALFSTPAFSAKPLVCVGDDGRDSTYEIRITKNAAGTAIAEIDESWGGGEELDSDTIQLQITETASRVTFTQKGRGANKAVTGLQLVVTKSRKPEGRLRMKDAPSARNPRPVSVAVSCK